MSLALDPSSLEQCGYNVTTEHGRVTISVPEEQYREDKSIKSAAGEVALGVVEVEEFFAVAWSDVPFGD